MRRRTQRRRRGHALMQAITRPTGRGTYDVILVDSRGNVVRTLVPGVSLATAHRLIRRRHS